MLYSKILDQILEAEECLDLTQFKFQGVNIWPLLRLEIYQYFLNKRPIYVRREQIGPLSFIVKLKNTFWGFLRFVQDFSDSFVGFNFSKGLSQTEVLYLSTDVLRTFKYKGRDFNRIIDSLKIFLGKGIILETKLKKEKKDPFSQVYYMDTASVVAVNKFRILQNWRQDIKLLEPKLIDLKKFLNNRYSIDLDIEEIKDYIIEVFGLRVYFKSLLSKVRPKIVFVDFYYHKKALALISASKAMGVKTIEMQHGIQEGPIYSGWLNCPEMKFDFLPDYFWVWNEIAKKKHKSWQGNINGHDCLNVGDVFVDFYRAFVSFSGVVNVKKTKQILVTLQDLREEHIKALNSKLVPAIIKLDLKEFTWIFRAHPEHKEKGYSWFNKYIGPNNFEGVYFDPGTCDLFQSIQESCLHITCSSSTIFEAMSFNVPSVIIEEGGEELFADYLSNSFINIAYSPKDIVQRVTNISKLAENNKAVDFGRWSRYYEKVFND